MHSNLTSVCRRFQKIFNPSKLLKLGRDCGLCVRERTITPPRLVLAFLTCFACRQVNSIADVQRCFNELFNCDVQYKPFHKQVSKPEFATFMHKIVIELMTHFSVRTMEPPLRGKFCEFDDILIQDGSSVTLNHHLKHDYPGRFTNFSPASVEIHATVSVIGREVTRIGLAPDTVGEREFLPDPRELNNILIMGDRGYESMPYCSGVDAAGGSFIFRVYCIDPVIESVLGDTKLNELLCGQRFRDALKLIPLDKPSNFL